MKRGVIILTAIIVGILLALSAIPQLRNAPRSRQLTITPPPSLSPTQTVISEPNLITIPSLNVHAKIEAVTVDDKGNMDIPKDYMNTAWYSPGPKPGQHGNAVIDGHVDTPTGAPAVFANLDKLMKGDVIEIKTKDGNRLTFAVEKVEHYPIENIPLTKIFDKTIQERRLNLITCGGIWDKEKKMYSERTVVYSKFLF